MKLSEFIINYRREHSFSQRQFADICGLSNSYISLLEKEINPRTKQPIIPSIVQFNKLASGMGITTQHLLESIDDMPIDISTEVNDPSSGSILPALIEELNSCTQEQQALVLSYTRFIKSNHNP